MYVYKLEALVHIQKFALNGDQINSNDKFSNASPTEFPRSDKHLLSDKRGETNTTLEVEEMWCNSVKRR